MGVGRGRRVLTAFFLTLLIVAVGCSADSQGGATTTGDPGDQLDPSIDSDGDGFTNGEEDDAGSDKDDATSTPNNVDTDDDGSTDAEEIAAGTDPEDPNEFPPFVDTGPVDAGEAQGVCRGILDDCVEFNEGSQTCHNIAPPPDVGGFSTELVFATVFNVRKGSEVTLVFRVVEGQAAGSPDERSGTAGVADDGVAVVNIPLYAPGEKLEIQEVLVNGEAVVAAQVGDFSFTVLALDDPTTECNR